MLTSTIKVDYTQLLQQIKQWSEELGFQQLGVSDIDLAEHEKHLNDWIAAGFHGEMDYMFKHGSKRSHPEQLVDNTCRVISPTFFMYSSTIPGTFR